MGTNVDESALATEDVGCGAAAGSSRARGADVACCTSNRDALSSIAEGGGAALSALPDEGAAEAGAATGASFSAVTIEGDAVPRSVVSRNRP